MKKINKTKVGRKERKEGKKDKKSKKERKRKKEKNKQIKEKNTPNNKQTKQPMYTLFFVCETDTNKTCYRAESIMAEPYTVLTIFFCRQLSADIDSQYC